VKSQKEQHRTTATPQNYFAPIPFRPTFSDRERGKNGARIAGFDRHWGNENPIDPQTGQPMSHVTQPNMPQKATPHKHSAAVEYTGKAIDNATGRVPDAGMDWVTGPKPGNVGPANTGGVLVQKHTRKDPILNWKDRDYDVSDVAGAVAPAKTGRSRNRK
jgi:hypothetical protein